MCTYLKYCIYCIYFVYGISPLVDYQPLTGRVATWLPRDLTSSNIFLLLRDPTVWPDVNPISQYQHINLGYPVGYWIFMNLPDIYINCWLVHWSLRRPKVTSRPSSSDFGRSNLAHWLNLAQRSRGTAKRKWPASDLPVTCQSLGFSHQVLSCFLGKL